MIAQDGLLLIITHGIAKVVVSARTPSQLLHRLVVLHAVADNDGCRFYYVFSNSSTEKPVILGLSSPYTLPFVLFNQPDIIGHIELHHLNIMLSQFAPYLCWNS